ncbi:MAG: ABC transporter substrate-binding protein [Candidatus Rifleibacteriota bacterium]
MKIRYLLIAATIISLVGFTGCSQEEKLPENISKVLNSADSDWLKLGIYGDPMDLNPLAHLESEHAPLVNSFVQASPLRELEDGSFEPYLFDTYSIYEGASDTVILEGVWKKNLKWHDGTDFDPLDLKFTFDLIADNENQSPFKVLLKGVDSVSSFGRGQRTRIVFKQDSRKLLELLTLPIIPSHIVKNKKIDKAKVAKEGIASDSWPNYVAAPIGLGPYMIKSRKRGSYVELKPFDHFYDNATRPAILIKSFFDYQKLVREFRANKLDWINLPSILAQQLKSMKLDNIFFIRYPNPANLTWMFNLNNSLLARKEMRYALDLLVDRNMIAGEVPFAGKALYSCPYAGSSEKIESYETRFKRAVELLENMGWKDTDSDGIRDKNGEKLELNIHFNDDNLLRRALAEKFAESCMRAGVKLNLTPVTWAELVSNNLKNGKYDTALISVTLPAAGNADYLFHSRSIPGEADKTFANKLNFSRINDERIDKLIEELDSMLEVENRAKKIAELGSLVHELRPVAFLYNPMDIGLMREESGAAQADAPIWRDVLNWKVLFGPEDSKL